MPRTKRIADLHSGYGADGPGAPDARKAGKTALARQKLLHRALLEVPLLHDNRVQGCDQVVDITQCTGDCFLFWFSWEQEIDFR